MSNSIHQDITINASIDKVYAALTEGEIFAAFTGGAAAAIAAEEGGEFSLFGGMIVGRNIEMIPGQRLVQAWRPGNWEAGVYSVVRFELEADGEATKIAMDHTGFPDGAREQLEGGWHKMYWQPLNEYLG
jgi:activator of HSP90 ATPase